MSEMTSGLVERIEAATGPDRELDGEIDRLFNNRPQHGDYDPDERALWRVKNGYSGLLVRGDGFARGSFCAPQFTASIDAAMTLVPEGLYPTIDFVERRCWLRSAQGHDVFHGPAYGFAETIPLAICAAALRARAPLPAPPAKDTI